MPPALIIVGFVLIAAAVLAYSLYTAKKRREDLHRLALIKRLSFYPRDPFDLPETYNSMRLCGKGHSKIASNVIAGPLGCGEVRYFDYRYTVGSGKDSHTYRKSGCAFHTPYHFKRLVVRPENLLDKAAAFVGFDDIDLDHAEFNRKFHVSCDDKKFAYDVLTQRAMEFLLSRSGITMEMGWNYVLFNYDRILSPDAVADMIEAAAAFADLLPNYFKQERTLGSVSTPVPPSAPLDRRPGAGTLAFDGIEPTARRRHNDTA